MTFPAFPRGLDRVDLKALPHRFADIQGSELAAALAYRMAAGLIPVVIFVAGVSGALLGSMGGKEPAVNAVAKLDTVLSDPGAAFVESRLRELINTSAWLPIAGGLLTSVWTGTFGGLSIIRVLNLVHDCEDARPLRRRLLMALGIGTTVVAGAILAFAVLLLGSLIPRGIAGGLGLDESFGVVVRILRWPLAFSVLWFAAGGIYALAPAKRGSVRAIATGALMFATLETAGSALLVVYVSHADTLTATYGTLTGLVVTLGWVYFTSLAFVLGALIEAQVRVSYAD